MKASRNEILTRPFALTADDATKLLAHLASTFPHLRLSAECADGITRKFAGADELLSYENARRQRITELLIFAASQDIDTSVMIRLSSDKKHNVAIVIDAEEELMAQLWRTIENRLESMRPWYYLLARIDFVYVLSGIVFLFGCSVLIIAFAAHGRHLLESMSSPAIGPIMIGGLIGCAPLPVGWILNKITMSVFPTAVFAIGQGTNRERNAHIIRTVVMAGFVVSVVAGIATALIIK